MDRWEASRLDALVALTDAAFPGEALSHDELLSACWEETDAVVLGLPDGRGAVSVLTRPGFDGTPVGYLVALAVEPAAQGSGAGRRLVDAAKEWAAGAGCVELYAGGGAPFYLWPGVDTRWTRALCLFESTGFDRLGAELNMSCPSSYRHPPPDGIEVDRVVEDRDAEAVVVLCGTEYPWWVDEATRGVEHGTCFAARSRDGDTVGFACHSVSRAGWLGPMATHPRRWHGGVGSALLGAVCADVAALGRPDVEIAWVGPLGFYARSAGAAVSRVFVRMRSRIGR